MQKIDEITTNLELKEPGIWFSKGGSSVSYPDEGNDLCLYVEENSFWFKHRNECITSVMNLYPPAGTLFDVGGGNGCVSQAVSKAGIESVVVEPGYSGALNSCKRGLCSICSTIESAGFKPHSIPSAGIFDALEHIENDLQFLKQLKTLLMKNGRIYISVPAYNFLWSYDDEFAGHFRRYTAESLRLLVESAGFEVEFSTYFFMFLPIPVYLFRTIPYKLGIKANNDVSKIKKDHETSGGLLEKLLNWSLKRELNSLKQNKAAPFGGSHLLVAKSI